MSEVKTLKMSSGEEVICKVEEIDEETRVFTINSPMVLQIIQGPTGYGLGLIPWMHSTKYGNIEVSLSHITALTDPDKDVTDAYLSQISGIKLASAGSILQG